MTTISGDTGITFPDDSIQSKAVSQATPFAITASAIAGAELQLPEATNNGVNYVAVKAPNTLAANTTFTLPAADGANGQFLQTDGSGALGFATVAETTPGGTTGQIQFNDAGAFGAVASGTTGQVLTSNGAGVAPSFATLVSGSFLRMTVFTSSGTWTKGAGTNFIRVRGVGGGGAGGPTQRADAAAGGGGAGGYFETFTSASALTTVAVTIGAGGTGTNGGFGGTGGTTTFGSLGSASGGSGGEWVQSTKNIGGTGGAATIGTLTVTGSGGGAGSNGAGATTSIAGAGGSSFFGGGAPGVNNTVGVSGQSGGGGGGGNISGGGAGGAGLVIVEEYT